MSNPDDGGPFFPIPIENDIDCAGRYASGYGGASVRLVLAAQFAAAWLPIIMQKDPSSMAGSKANEYGLAMADDLIRRVRESA